MDGWMEGGIGEWINEWMGKWGVSFKGERSENIRLGYRVLYEWF